MLRRVTFRDIPELKESCGTMELNGPFPGVPSPGGHLSFCTMDAHVPGYDNPMLIPKDPAHPAYSFVKSVYFEVTDWHKFADVLGCETVRDIGVFLEAPILDHSLEMLVSHKSIQDYSWASGIVGVTGDHIRGEVSDLSRSSISCPYLFDTGSIYNGSFRSNLLQVQLKLCHDAMYGEFRFPELVFSGLVE